MANLGLSPLARGLDAIGLLGQDYKDRMEAMQKRAALEEEIRKLIGTAQQPINLELPTFSNETPFGPLRGAPMHATGETENVPAMKPHPMRGVMNAVAGVDPLAALEMYGAATAPRLPKREKLGKDDRLIEYGPTGQVKELLGTAPQAEKNPAGIDEALFAAGGDEAKAREFLAKKMSGTGQETALWNNALTAAGGDPVKAREIMYLSLTGGARSMPQSTPYVSRATGNPVMRNTQTGSYMDGDMAIDPSDLVPGSAFDKDTETARTILGEIAQADTLESKINSMPEAFKASKVRQAALKGIVPKFGPQLAAETFTTEENALRAEVAQNAAAIINKLYGAALSEGESDRAKTFTPDPNDTVETLLPKLKAAKEWAISRRKGLLPSAISRAERQLGGPQRTPDANVIRYVRRDGKLVRE